MNVMIVESPNKIATIKAILGNGWEVVATVGHFRDLPRKEIGVAPPDFELRYEFTPDVKVKDRTFDGGEKRLKRIAAAIAQADHVYIATDPDREGEAIAWHVADAARLEPSRYQRVTFDELSESMIRKAIDNPRAIDMDRVYAQEARRALDRLVGYTVSPMLSGVLGMNVSAGRVQSPAVRLVVDRERAVAAFKPTTHFSAKVSFDNTSWVAEWDTRSLVSDDAPYILDRDLAERIASCRTFQVAGAERGQAKRKPPSPFSTSLLLQAASTTLNFDPKKTARLAQRLFEKGSNGQGAINYIRTDSVNFAEEVTDTIREYAQSQGFDVPEKARRYKSKEGAQEGHDAIRPIDMTVEIAGDTDDERALYQLIRQRTLASQLCDAVYDVNTLTLECELDGERYQFMAKGRVLVEPGWQAITKKDSIGSDEDDEALSTVPALEQGTQIIAEDGEVVEKTTRASPRFTQATLVAKLEDEGIGRPSTYPSILDTIIDKGYLVEKKRFLYPTQLGVDLVGELAKAGFGFIDLSFTRELEDRLDAIASGHATYLEVVEPVYAQLVADVEKIRESGEFKPRHPCPACGGPLFRFKSKTRGLFWACRVEGCDTFLDDVEGVPTQRKAYPCPKCDTTLKRFKRKNQSGFVWVCPAESCETFLDDIGGKPAVHECPACGSLLKRFKHSGEAKGHGWFCTNSDCSTFLDDSRGKPVQTKTAPCPKCDGQLVRRKGPHGYWWGCNRYKEGCEVRMADEKGRPVSRKKSSRK